MIEFFKKFLSRKFLVCLIGLIVGLATAHGVDASEYQQIAGNVVSLVSIVAYILGEAKIDAASAAANALNDAVDSIELKVEPVTQKPPDEKAETADHEETE